MKFPDFRRYITLNISAYMFLICLILWIEPFFQKGLIMDHIFALYCIFILFLAALADLIFFMFPAEAVIRFLVNRYIFKDKKLVFNFPKNKFFTFLKVIYNIFFVISAIFYIVCYPLALLWFGIEL